MRQPYCDKILDHYRSVWDGEAEPIAFERGPIHDLPRDFRVIRFKPGRKQRMWIYATQCMSSPEDSDRLELHMRTKRRQDEVVELLTVTAHYHRTGARLKLGDSVNFGQPWLPGSQCARGLLSLPYIDGPRLEWMEYLGRPVRCLWMIPVTESELKYRRTYGIHALETLFEQTKFDYADPYRAPVVPPEW